MKPTPEQAEILIGHYPDDEGVGHNGGRQGARQAPDCIMPFLLKMTTPAFSKPGSLPGFHVVGSPKQGLAHFDRLEVGRNLAHKCLSSGKKWIGIGGGHDYGYSDGAGFLDCFTGSDIKPLVINFDAHLDVRPLDRSAITSGTPFSRLLEMQSDFEFIEVGVRDFCNSTEHARWAEERGAKVLPLDQLRAEATGGAQTMYESLSKIIDSPTDASHPCYLSVDIDVFSSSFAMGCSQSWPTGMTPDEYWPMMKWIMSNFDVQALGIYEVSPPLDDDNRTSKLAAEIIYQYLQGYNKAEG
ncbi:MAG: arginase family protein [Bdellovibrionales bacterium]|nr:arginase family protein [Bdellovibrionales bacterium]